MKKTIVCIFLLILLAIPVSAEQAVDSSFFYAADTASLLTDSQRQRLSDDARRISEQYSCGVYFATFEDYTEYYDGTIKDCAAGIYSDYRLGFGSDRDGILLVLSAKSRDYCLYSYGTAGNRAFTDYGKKELSKEFLDNFGKDDWNGGFSDYLKTCESDLALARSGKPVDRDSTFQNLALIILPPCAVAAAVCLFFKRKMKSARKKTQADDYITGNGLELRIQEDHYTHTTETRRKIQKSSSGSTGEASSGKF